MTHYPKIYYVSQGKTPQAHLNNIENVCRAGVKFVQLRLKNTPIEIVRETAEKAVHICQKFNTQLFINDHAEALSALPNIGLHIGKNDLPMSEARAKYGSSTIGGTANTLEDCLALSKNGANYIGLGPFRHTTTKTNLEPILGLEGYQDIIKKLRSLKIDLPVYAIGGITETDIQPLLDLGLAGVAVSGLLSNKTVLEIKEMIKLYE